MYKDIFESIRNAAEKRNLRERTVHLYCSDVGYFLRCTNKPVDYLTLEDAAAFSVHISLLLRMEKSISISHVSRSRRRWTVATKRPVRNHTSRGVETTLLERQKAHIEAGIMAVTIGTGIIESLVDAALMGIVSI